MNKELEEAIKICNDFIEENKSRKIILHKSIETVLKALENSVPKDIIKEKLEKLNNSAKIHKDKTILTIIEREKLVLKELLEEK